MYDYSFMMYMCVVLIVYGYMMIGYKIECIVNYLFFLIIEKRIYYLWTKYGQKPLVIDHPPKDPESIVSIPLMPTQKTLNPKIPRSFKKVKKSGKKSQKRYFF
jgi:hypothetical protein